MGLLNRSRQAASANPELWQPVQGQQVQRDSAEQIAGSAAVCATAYRVHFALPAAPMASVAIWAYAVEAHPDEASPGPYAVGFRCEWWLGEQMLAAWNEQDWDAFGSPAAADSAALADAEQYAQTPDRGAEMDEEFFGWDGAPDL